MKSRVMRWAAVVGMVGAGVIAVAGPAPVANAVPPTRVNAVSSATGAAYYASWSCAGGQVRFAVNKPAGQMIARFKMVGVTDSWLSRGFSTSAGWSEMEPGGQARNDNEDATQIILEDKMGTYDENPAAWTPVLTLNVPDCPDYSIGDRSVFQSIAPTRVLDTRAATAINYTGAKPGVGGIVKVARSSFPGIPAGATAVSVTVTGTEASGPGFLQAFPTGRATPGSSSNVNLPAAGSTVANLAIVPLGTDGSISVLASNGSHILVDVNGYFVEQAGTARAGRLETIAQKRLLDTRPQSPINFSGPQPNGNVITVDLTDGTAGVPDGASAAVVNITATESAGPGYVQAAAGGTLVKGKSSVLNLTAAGQTVAAMSIVPVSADGKIDLYTLIGSHLVVDLIGWFTGPTAELSSAGLFVPLSPERIFDSRPTEIVNPSNGRWRAEGMRDEVIYLPGMERVHAAVFINGTATENVAPGYVTFGEFNITKPTSSVNMSAANTNVANAAIVKTDSYWVNIRASVITHVVVDLAGYFTQEMA